jgi:hypothetical protein
MLATLANNQYKEFGVNFNVSDNALTGTIPNKINDLAFFR